MSVTLFQTVITEVQEGATAGTGGAVRSHRTATTRIDSVDRYHAQFHTLSNDVSLASIAITPLGTNADTASHVMLMLEANHAVDVRLGAESATPLSGVYKLAATLTVSAIYLSTGSQATVVRTELAGGSNASITASVPVG